MTDIMRKIVLSAAAVLLAAACGQNDDWNVYNGDYTVDRNTVIVLNGRNVDISDYENAEISIMVKEGNNCDIILRNFITGQPEITVPASLETGDTKAAAGAGFSGSTEAADRTVRVEGMTADTSLASISITEEITVEGIPGKWALDSIRTAFFHPSLEEIDFSEAVPGLILSVDELTAMINSYINSTVRQDPSISGSFIEFTRDGYINPSEDLLCYYIRPADNTMYIFLRKSIVEEITDSITANPDIMAVITMLGLTSFIDTPQSMSIPLQYSIADGGLTVTASQVILDPYEDMLTEPLAMISAILYSMDYEDFSSLLGDTLAPLAGIITEDNFAAFKEVLINTFNTLTDGQAEYSVSAVLIPFTE